jgi:hypothetical protein
MNGVIVPGWTSDSCPCHTNNDTTPDLPATKNYIQDIAMWVVDVTLGFD